jgi:NAD(P)-dependent dehydrogenase (short-subunit alcohol dehydrogenase family)
VAALENTQGYIVIISSAGAQLRVPGASDACISKFAVNRLVEFIVLGKPLLFCKKIDNIKRIIGTEHPSVRAFALAPGLLPTRLAGDAVPAGADGGGGLETPDAIALPASTMLYLTSGPADWLSGRFVHFTIRRHFF